MYGCGLRLMETVRLRVQDIDFAQHQIIVRQGKGHKDRDTLLPDRLIAPLQRQLRYAKALHDNDLERGYGQVYLPFALYPRHQSRRPGRPQSPGRLRPDPVLPWDMVGLKLPEFERFYALTTGRS
jgi:integrase